MKILNKIFALSIGTAMLFGCNDMLDTEPNGGTVTQGQKEDVFAGDPEMLVSDVNGLWSGLIKQGTISDWDDYHYDYGYAAACLMFDCSGQDMSSPNTGYNWFRAELLFTDRVYTSSNTYYFWKFFYNHIKTANDILAIVPEDTDNATLKVYRGQALASRAFDYLNLVQIYQFTYAGHENALGVPIVTEKTTREEAQNNPRATVAKVYEQIIGDLNAAIPLLEGYTRKTKDVINQNVAYGLRARANLNMEHWAEAAADAEKAIAEFTPYTIAEVSTPTFNSAATSSWIWGNIITEINDVVLTGIINWPSHLCSMTGNGYTTGVNPGTWRSINKSLWTNIPATDVRKGWWVDEDLASPLTDDIIMTYKGKEYPAYYYYGWEPYTNVKFGAYQSKPDNTTNASDWPMMRVEEMMLIQAEGLAKGGNPDQGKAVLEDFVKTYRNPSYVCPASDPDGLQNEIWFQRRIELWGEGFSLFDVKRLKKPVIRKGENFPKAMLFNLDAEAPILLWRIPEVEIQTNKGITDADNNPNVPQPKV